MQSTQPITLYITVNITPPNLDNKSSNLPTKDADSPTEEMSPAGTEDAGFALHRADEAMKQIVPTGRSNAWERAAGRIKWVMDTLSPIAEVRVIPF